MGRQYLRRKRVRLAEESFTGIVYLDKPLLCFFAPRFRTPDSGAYITESVDPMNIQAANFRTASRLPSRRMLAGFCLCAAPMAFLFSLATASPAQPPQKQKLPERYRSPYSVALTPNGAFALTANQTSDSVSLVDITAGKVVSEVAVGERPFAVTVTADGKRALVTNSWGNSVTILDVAPTGLKVVRTVGVGDEPRGVVVSRDGRRAFIALANEDKVATLNLETLTVTAKWAVGTEPWHVALTPDGGSLVVANTRSRTVSILDAANGSERFTVKTLGRNLRQLAISGDGEWAYLPSIAERGAGVSKENIDRGWIISNRLTRVPLKAEGPREAITLDLPRNGVADVDGCALSPDGKRVVLTAAGTHDMVVMPVQNLPFVAYGGPGDLRDPSLQNNTERFWRIRLGGRPLGVTFTPDGSRVVVANYLENAVQVVDLESGAVRSIDLGGPATPDAAREGEIYFYDARRSFGAWYSCSSCHTEGNTNGGNFDTLNDGGIGKPKKTPSLRGVAETAPYTWHGWNKDLKAALHESMIKTMQMPEPSEEDVTALLAFVKTLRFRPNPNRVTTGPTVAALQRGEKVFQAKGCTTCHGGPNFTTPQVYTVGLEMPDDVYQGFNPPTLRGVYARAPYLHDGRAKTLEEVLTTHHRPSQVGGVPDCTPEELADLVAYLRSL